MFGKKRETGSEKKTGFVKRLRARLNQGDSWLTYDLANLAPGGKIDEDVLEELEAELVMADVGVDAAGRIVGSLQKRLARQELKDVDALRQGLHKSLVDVLAPVAHPLEVPELDTPFVILMVGVNGAGKTTTIGKLARRFLDDGKSVMLAAGDTFRAAAVEQLQAWENETMYRSSPNRPGQIRLRWFSMPGKQRDPGILMSSSQIRRVDCKTSRA